MSLDYIRKNIVVCNGGDTTSDAMTNILALNSVHYLRIPDGDLWVADTANSSLAYVLSCQVNHRLYLFVFQGMSHSVL
jgi:hypothetical protein